MNNRFKFRVWNGAKYYCENNFILPSGELGFFVESMGYPHYRIFSKQENFTIEQCTGLKDKNAELIYENDIVRFHWTEMSPQEFIVKWNNSKKCFDFCEYKNKKRGNRFYYWWECFKTCKCDFAEIIGNIHETKEDA